MDLILRNARIVGASGHPGVDGDIGVNGSRIVAKLFEAMS